MSKPIVILCEDVAQQNFLRRLVMRRGFTNRDIDPVALPAGKGAGDRHVLADYPRQAASVRAESGFRRRCLVVAIDADENPVNYRYKQLEDKLNQAEELRDDHRRRREEGELIAIFVPKWHIETWIDYLLDGGPVSEDKPSQRHRKATTKHCTDAADRFLELAAPATSPTNCPPSLQRGLAELPRIPEK